MICELQSSDWPWPWCLMCMAGQLVTRRQRHFVKIIHIFIFKVSKITS